MSVFKCKYCGAMIEYEDGVTVDICPNCSVKQQLSGMDEEAHRKDTVYYRAEAVTKIIEDKKRAYQLAISDYKSIPGWKDADERLAVCEKELENIEAREEAYRLKIEREDEECRIAAENTVKKRKKIFKLSFMIVTPIICAVIAFVVLLNSVIIPNKKYDAVVELFNNGEIAEAYENLIALTGHKKFVKESSEIYNQYVSEIIKNAEVGETVIFGAYEQDNNSFNGKEAIEWRVLAKEDNRIFVISDKALDCKQYNKSYTAVTWETCSLRTWLNSTFLNEAFNAEEQLYILSTEVSMDENEFGLNNGNSTTDKVFLLSRAEAEEYFSSDEERICVPTSSAVAEGAYTYTIEDVETCYWWLRSLGYSRLSVTYIDHSGYYDFGMFCISDYVCVRPAMWINLDS